MDGHLYFTSNHDEDSELCLAPLTDDDAAAAGINPDTSHGYYLYEKSRSNPTDISILAHVDDDEAAFTLSRLLKMD